MNKARETGINNCKDEFKDIISISRGTSGEVVLELGTENAFYFQIKWKLIPSIKHFAKIKNFCRIACTQDGNNKEFRLHLLLNVMLFSQFFF